MHRILHIIPSLLPSGTTTQLSLLAAGLARGEFETHVAVLDDAPHSNHNVPLARVETTTLVPRRRFMLDPLALWRLHRHIRRLQPDLIHTWLFDANSYGRIAAKNTAARHLVATERHLDHGKSAQAFALDRRLASRTSKIIVNSVAVQDFCHRHGIPNAKIELIPAGAAVDPNPKNDQNSNVDRPALLAKLGLPADAKLVAFVGPLTKHKRIKELIWATDQLRAVGVPAHLLIVGDGPLRSALERYARLTQIQHRVHFLGFRNCLQDWLPHVDLLWQSGDREGQSQAVLEAMAAAVPVIAADAPGNRELVVSGETGHLVPLTERAGFARYSLPLLDDPVLARQFGTAARQRAIKRHSLAEMLARYASLYHQLLN